MPSELSSKIYESTATAYNLGRKADPVIADVLGKNLILNPDETYLDIGCGTGNYTNALAKKGFNIQGIDLSPSMLKEAKNRFPNLIWHKADMRKLPFQSHSFNGVVSVNTLHYVRHSMIEVFCEINRVLKKGGRLVLFLVTLEQCLQFWIGHYFPFFWDLGKEILIPENNILKSLRQAGFTNLKMNPYYVTKKSEDLFIYACKYRPHLLLDPSIRKGMTPFQRPEYELDVDIGCQHLKEDLETGAIKNIIDKHESSLGEGIFISCSIQ